MARLEPRRPDELTPDQRALYDAIVTGPRAGAGLTDETGALRGPFDPLLRVPAVGDAVQRLGAAIRYEGTLPADLRELAVLTVASHWGCRFELRAHGPLARKVGVDAAVVDALTHDGDATAPPRPELPPGSPAAVVHHAVVELLTTRRLGDATYAAAVATLGEAAVVELVLLAGYYAMLAMVLEGFEIA